MINELDAVTLRLIIWITENLLKVVFGVGILFTLIKIIFVVRSSKIMIYFIFKLYGSRFKTHIFYKQANKIKDAIDFGDIDIQPERIELARHILMVEYRMLYNYTIEMVNYFTTKKNVNWFNFTGKYVTDSIEAREYMLKHLRIMRKLSMEGLRIHEIPEPVIARYKQYRPIIYNFIESAITTLESEYQFTPLMLWGFLNFNYIYFTQLKIIISYFVRSLNGELKDSKYYPPFPEIFDTQRHDKI